MTSREKPAHLAEIIEMSRWAGEPDRDLVILAEGNTSLKSDGRILIKGSGSELRAASETDFVEINPRILDDLLERGDASDAEVSETLLRSRSWGTRSPSVETLLHVVCQASGGTTAVIHTHPTAVNSLLCSSKAELLVTGSYFPDQIVTMGRNPLLVPYIDPGLPLAFVTRKLLAEHVAATGAPPKVIYLRNHGMFALGGTVAEAKQITMMAVKCARVILGAASVGVPVTLSPEHAARIDTRPDELLRRRALGSH